MQDRSEHTNSTPNTPEGPSNASERHIPILVTHWAPIPLQNTLRMMMDMRRYPEWHRGHAYKFTTNQIKRENGVTARQRSQIGYLWINSRDLVVRWRGRSYRRVYTGHVWNEVQAIINDAERKEASHGV